MKNGWQWKPLGEVCKTGSGGTPLKNKKEYYEGGTIPWLMSGEVSQGEVREATKFITQKGLENSAARIFPKNTVLVAMYGATAGQVGILRFEATTNQAVCGIFPNKQFVPEFLFYFLLSKKDELVAQATGNAQPNISQIKIKNTDVPILPLPEQQRIVGILDEAFEGIATAKANAVKNLQNARALFESHLGSVFSDGGKTWDKRPLELLCSLFVDSAHRTPQYQEEGIPALRPRDVVNGELNLSGAARVSEKEYEIQAKRHKPAMGDIVYSRELSFGWAALLPKSPRVCLSQGMCLFRPSHQLDSAFLLHVLNGSVGREQAVRAAVGAAHPHINLSDIRSYLIPLPPVTLQKQIAAEFDTVQAESKRLEFIYKQKLAALEELKKSLLHQAFAGKL